MTQHSPGRDLYMLLLEANLGSKQGPRTLSKLPLHEKLANDPEEKVQRHVSRITQPVVDE